MNCELDHTFLSHEKRDRFYRRELQHEIEDQLPAFVI